MTEHHHEEMQALLAELEDYRKEKEQIRQVIGAIGGAASERRDRLFNQAFVMLLFIIFSFDILRHVFHFKIDFLPAMFSLEIGVLLVSIKIIWMIHKQAKVEHFQFWILNSIEFRLNTISKKLREVAKKIEIKEPAPSETTGE